MNTDNKTNRQNRGAIKQPAIAGSIDQTLGKTIKQLRVQADKTQADIAEYLEISAQQYQKYEKGATKCNLETIYKLAAYYDLQPFDILPKPDGSRAGFQEEASPFNGQQMTPIHDEASAVAELLSVFIRIPSKETRRKVLSLLDDLA